MHSFRIWRQLLAKDTSIRAARALRGRLNAAACALLRRRVLSPAVARTLESLEGRQMLSAVTSFTLINADTDKDLMTLGNGATLNLKTLPTRNLSIRANFSGAAESVRFAFDGNSNYHTESSAPYSIAGDTGTNYDAWSPPLGAHTLKATPYSADGASGSPGTSHQVSFSVISGTSTATSTSSSSASGPLSAPVSLVADAVASNQIDLSWDDKSANESRFDILRSTDGSNYVVHDSVGAGVTDFSDGEVSGAKTYYYKVRAANSTDKSVPSNLASAKTPSGGTTTTSSTSSAPSAPSSLLATANSPTQIYLGWRDNASNEQGFKVFRSTDGNSFSQIGTTPSGDADYTDSSVSAGRRYYYRVFAYNSSGTSGYSNDDVTTPTSASTPAPAPSYSGSLRGPSQTVVNLAIGEPLVRYNRSIAGGAHTNQTHDGESPLVLALASFTGNTSADSRLLQQLRYSITGGNEITATGGYPAQHERHVTAMFTLARMTPRIWNQLSSSERAKVDLIMKASLIASAFTTGDSNPFIKSGGQHYALDGNSNLGRDWNPNYREGMIGAMLVGMVYFGGPSNANAVLAGYDHDSFVGQLKSYGLTNIAQTFTWKSSNPTSNAPSGSAIETAVRAGYRYYGLGLSQYMDIYGKLVTFTYGREIEAGVNDGAGISGYGRIASGASGVDNLGAMGMLTEFASSDGNGARSSAAYAYDGYRTHQANQLMLVAGGFWQEDHSAARTAVAHMEVGVADLWYKLERGYLNYAKGAPAGTTSLTTTDRGFAYTRDIWENVLSEFHGI